MKSIFLLLTLFLIFSLSAIGQEVRYSQVIPGDTTHNKNILNRLIFLAWQNNPDNHERINNVEAAKYFAKKTGYTWLNQVSFLANVNEYTITGNKVVSQYFPIYNLGVNIPFGIFFTAPYETKQARAQYKESLDRLNSAKLETRLKVTTTWEEFRMFHRQLSIQQQINENAYTDFLANEKKFKDGKLSLKDYNVTLTHYSELLMTKIQLERNVHVSKANIERLIGVNLDEIVSGSSIDNAED